jgi:hypothetical protein
MCSLFGQVYSNCTLLHHLALIQSGVEETSEASGVDAEQEMDEELKKVTAIGAEGVCSLSFY